MLENRLLKVLFVVLLSAKGSFVCVTYALPEEEYKQVGTAIYKECSWESENSKVNLKWVYPNGTDISIDSLLGSKSRTIYAVKPDSDQPYAGVNLHVPKLTLSMSGTYKCVYEDHGQIHTVQNYTVVAYEPLYFIQKPKQFVSLNKNSTISCEVKGGTGELYISWKKMKHKNQITEDINDGEKYQTNGNVLMIKNVDDDDKGEYICDVLDMRSTEPKNYTITVEVMIEPVIEDIIVSPEPEVVAGESLYIECKAHGIPYPDVTWSKTSEKVPIPAESNSTGEVKMNQLSFEQITPEDQGSYRCLAKNAAGEASREIFVKVLVPPKIIRFNNVTETDGTVTQLICETISRPEANVTITFLGKNEDRELTEADVYENLKFLNVKPEIEGYYLCNASNEIDFTAEKMYLSVLHRPYFKNSNEILWGWPGTSVNLSCESDANPAPKVTWRYIGGRYGNEIAEITGEGNSQIRDLIDKLNNLPEPFLTINISHDTELYGDYDCNATNDLGSQRKIISLHQGFIPFPVSNVTGEVKASEVLFKIMKPFVEGPDILGYMAEYDEDSNYEVTYIHKNRTWSIDREPEGFKLEGLKPNTLYRIRFAAKNEVGIGDWGEVYNFTTLKPSAPSPPIWELASNIINVTEDQILTWKASEDNGDPVDNYLIRYCQDYRGEEETCKEIVTSNSNLQIHASVLSANSTFNISLQAKNNFGISSPTNIIVNTPAKLMKSQSTLPVGAIIGISIMIVLLALLVLDMLLCMCRRQGMIAHCYYNTSRTRNDENLQIRDKKGLLKDNCEPPEDNTKKHKEFEYNKATGIITGKHSSV